MTVVCLLMISGHTPMSVMKRNRLRQMAAVADIPLIKHVEHKFDIASHKRKVVDIVGMEAAKMNMEKKNVAAIASNLNN